MGRAAGIHGKRAARGREMPQKGQRGSRQQSPGDLQLRGRSEDRARRRGGRQEQGSCRVPEASPAGRWRQSLGVRLAGQRGAGTCSGIGGAASTSRAAGSSRQAPRVAGEPSRAAGRRRQGRASLRAKLLTDGGSFHRLVSRAPRRKRRHRLRAQQVCLAFSNNPFIPKHPYINPQF